MNCVCPQGILQGLLPDVEVGEGNDYEEWLETFVKEAGNTFSVANGPSTPSPDSSVSSPHTQANTFTQTHTMLKVSV